MPRASTIAVCLYAILAALTAGWVYFDAFETALDEDRQSGMVRLSEATRRLIGQLDVYRAIVNMTAKNSRIARAVEPNSDFDVNDELAILKLTYGAWEIDLVDLRGTVRFSSASDRVGRRYSRRLIAAALNGRLGYTAEIENGHRLIRFSRRVARSKGRSLGVVVVSANLAALEFEWPVTPEPIAFFDARGVAISSNRPYLLLLSSGPGEAGFPLRERRGFSKTPLWTFAPLDNTVTEVQVMSSAVPQLRLTGRVFLDTGNARDFALLRLGLVLTLLVALALVGAIILQQRRRLAMESRHSALLEQRVEERTAELRAAQDELVAASNLAALGRLSAGISHELNQPLAAILNFAENGKRLISNSRTDRALQNLTQIGEQIRRINRIIGNLRAFAKQGDVPLNRIDLVAGVNRAIDLMRDEIEAAQVTANISLPAAPIHVTAGKVRLEQVILNLISNALDAMQGSEEKVLSISLSRESGDAILSVKDTGPGIKEPERVFEPFYTTKKLGSSQGLGMGLALSFGIIARFGGRLGCRNHQAGAEFTVSLPIASEAT